MKKIDTINIVLFISNYHWKIGQIFDCGLSTDNIPVKKVFFGSLQFKYFGLPFNLWAFWNGL